MSEEQVVVEHDGPVTIVTINRPQVRNAVDQATAELLYAAFPVSYTHLPSPRDGLLSRMPSSA